VGVEDTVIDGVREVEENALDGDPVLLRRRDDLLSCRSNSDGEIRSDVRCGEHEGADCGLVESYVRKERGRIRRRTILHWR
jgi:hypothetical protein